MSAELSVLVVVALTAKSPPPIVGVGAAANEIVAVDLAPVTATLGWLPLIAKESPLQFVPPKALVVHTLLPLVDVAVKLITIVPVGSTSKVAAPDPLAVRRVSIVAPETVAVLHPEERFRPPGSIAVLDRELTLVTPAGMVIWTQAMSPIGEPALALVTVTV